MINIKSFSKKALAITLLVVLAAGMLVGCGCSKTADKESKKPLNIKVVKEEGDKAKIIKANLNVRDAKLGSSIKKIKKYEDKQKDTADKPNESSSQDGYTYVIYSFDSKNAKECFGVKPGEASSGAMLTYVFFDKKLTELRLQYGKVGLEGYNKIIESLTSTFGAPTYSNTFSNDAKSSEWNTAKTQIQVVYQDGSVTLYFRKK